MTVPDTMTPLEWLRKHLDEASPDLLREMVGAFAETLMAAEADALCNATYGERSPERVNRRNGYRERASTPGWARSSSPSSLAKARMHVITGDTGTSGDESQDEEVAALTEARWETTATRLTRWSSYTTSWDSAYRRWPGHRAPHAVVRASLGQAKQGRDRRPSTEDLPGFEIAPGDLKALVCFTPRRLGPVFESAEIMQVAPPTMGDCVSQGSTAATPEEPFDNGEGGFLGQGVGDRLHEGVTQPNESDVQLRHHLRAHDDGVARVGMREIHPCLERRQLFDVTLRGHEHGPAQLVRHPLVEMGNLVVNGRSEPLPDSVAEVRSLCDRLGHVQLAIEVFERHVISRSSRSELL